MEKEFNVTGCCNPKRHYMVDISCKFDKIMDLINKGKYFSINRPRQYGKTTMLDELERQLEDTFILCYLSFEGIGDTVFEDESRFCQVLVEIIAESLKTTRPLIADNVLKLGKDVFDLKTLSQFISQFTSSVKNDVILLIDEVDKSCNSQLFLSFLGMLRQKYLLRERDKDTTFLSVILAGVHDIKSLKLKVREGCETKLNSPWNIAADFNVDMSFNPVEIRTMLEMYALDKGVKMNFDMLSERIYYYTNGYPFLVSKLCKNIDEEEATQRPEYNPKHWTLADVDWAFRWLTRPMYTTTNFDDMIKNLENNDDLFNVVRAISVEGIEVSASVDNPVVNLGIIYGILSEKGGQVVITNRIYEQRIATYLQSKKEIQELGNISYYHEFGYIKDKRLDITFILSKFQDFMKEHYSDKDSSFLEREGRLVFMSFLKPIINGKGFMWKEPVTGDERRMDLVITYGATQKEVIELKIWRGQEYHQQGLQQLSSYLDFQNLKNGYLVIFNFSKSREQKAEQLKFQNKNIFSIWV